MNSQKLVRNTVIAIAAVLLLYGAFYAGYAAASSGVTPESGMLQQLRIARDEGLVAKALRMLEDAYFVQIDDQGEKQLIYGALDGMFNTLRQDPWKDQFSHFYDPKLLKDLQAQTEGHYAGIGILMGPTADGMYPEAVAIFPGTPAEKAGLQENDILAEVDGEDTFGMFLDQVAAKIKGLPGTKIKLRVYRPADGEFYTFEIERKEVQFSSVSKVEMLDNGVGYIEITNFAEETGPDFRRALEQLSSQGMKSLVIDLRNNTGGILQAAIDVADCFVKDGVIVTVNQRKGEPAVNMANPELKKYDIPLVVLINSVSASASEVLTGCLKDYGLARIVGEKSFGKGVVQEVIPLETEQVEERQADGRMHPVQRAKSAVAVTIGKYFTPKGHDIHGIGIVPDIWYDVNNMLLDEPKLKDIDDRMEAKRKELAAIRTEFARYIRANDLEKNKARDIAVRLAKGEQVPDAPQIKPKEEDHTQYLSSSEAANPAVKPKNDEQQKSPEPPAKESGK